MIDSGSTKEEVDFAIDELDMSKGHILDEKFKKVHDQIILYAEKHSD